MVVTGVQAVHLESAEATFEGSETLVGHGAFPSMDRFVGSWRGSVQVPNVMVVGVYWQEAC